MIRSLFNIYILVLILDVILSYLPQFKDYPPAVYIKKASSFTCGPIRKLLKDIVPKDIPFDFSPFIVILAIKMLEVLW